MDLIKVNCLKHIYPDRTEVAVCGLEFSLKKGERTVILGPNGSGKTTLLSHIMGLLEPVEGEIMVFGKNPKKEFAFVRKDLGVVFQNVDQQLIGPTVWDDIAFTPSNSGIPYDKLKVLVDEILIDVGISRLRNKVLHYLSGGEKKKVAIAGAMVMRPKLLILDEPFDGLDPISKRDIINLLIKLNTKHGTAVLITTHDINIVPSIAETVYILNNGKLVYKGTPEEVFNQEEILKQANLECPILVQLTKILSDAGLPIKTTVELQDAAEQIISMVR